MTLGALGAAALRSTLSRGGLGIQIGPFVVRVSTPIVGLQDYLRSHYRAFPVVDAPGAHFALTLQCPRGPRQWLRPQVVLTVNGQRPFTRVPERLAPGLFEWGLNWAIGTTAHRWLVVHSAVVERAGRAVLFPAQPGSGKSTLCAALTFAGWRLLSDEFALVDPATAELVPLPRPISLKGQSVDLMAARVPDLRLGPLLADADGRSARHVAPPAAAVEAQSRRARARWLVVPKWHPGTTLQLEPTGRARMLAHMADSSFNYNMVGSAGFSRLAEIVSESGCYRLTYEKLDDALALFERLAAGAEDATGLAAS